MSAKSTTLITIAVVVALGLFIFWYAKSRDNKELLDFGSPKKLGALPAAISTANVPNHEYENGDTLTDAINEYNNTPISEMPSSPNFGFEEFWTRDASYNRYPPPKEYWPDLQKVMDQLEIIRSAVGNKAININSGVRSLWHNADAGGVSNSRHRVGKAADITISGGNQYHNIIKELIDNGSIEIGGFGRGLNWSHIDTRAVKSTWSYNY